MSATSTGRGYWLVASDGGTFDFGDPQREMPVMPAGQPWVAVVG